MENILITVIVAVYNGEKYIDKCIGSILSQTYKSLEILIINDGSTDSSGERCDQYSKIDSRVKIFHRRNSGLSAVRNYSINIATGKYLMFVDMDDWLEPTIVEYLLNKCESDDLDFSSCSANDYFEKTGEKIVVTRGGDKIFNNKEGIIDFYYNRKFTFDAIQAKLYKSDIMKKINFNEERKGTDDTLTTPLIMDQCKKMGYYEIPLYNYLHREGSMSKSKYNLNSKDKVLAYLDNYDLIKSKYPEALPLLEHNIYASAAANKLKLEVLNLKTKHRNDYVFYEMLLKKYKPIISKKRLFISIYYFLSKIPFLYSLTIMVFKNFIKKKIEA